MKKNAPSNFRNRASRPTPSSLIHGGRPPRPDEGPSAFDLEMSPLTRHRMALLDRANALGRHDLIARASSARKAGCTVDAMWDRLERALDRLRRMR